MFSRNLPLRLPTASTSPTLGEVHPKVSPTPKGFTSTVGLGPMARTLGWLLVGGVFLKKMEEFKKKKHLPFFNTPSKKHYLFRLYFIVHSPHIFFSPKYFIGNIPRRYPEDVGGNRGRLWNGCSPLFLCLRGGQKNRVGMSDS